MHQPVAAVILLLGMRCMTLAVCSSTIFWSPGAMMSTAHQHDSAVDEAEARIAC